MANYWEKKLKELEEEKKSGYWNRKTAELNRDQKRQNASKGKYDDDDDDIAPVRTTTKSKKDEEEDDGLLDIFQKGSFSDGFDWSDIPSAILGTTGDALLHTAKGVGGVVEGVTDLANYGRAFVHDKIGNDEKAADLRERTQESYIDNLTKPWEEKLDNYSILGRTSEAAFQGLGQIGLTVVTGGVASGLGKAGATIATSGLMGLSGTGSGISEAYKGGANDLQALKHGMNSGAADAISEMIFGGMGKFINAIGFSKGLSSADDILAKLASSKAKNQVSKNLIEFGIKSGAEGVEEVVAGVAQAYSKYHNYLEEQGVDFVDVLKDENLLEQFVVGSMSSGMTQSGLLPGTKQGSLIESNKTGRDFVSGLTEGEQKVVDRVVQDEIAKREEKGEKVSGKEKSKIYESVISDMDKGYISIDTIEEVLGGDTYTAYKHREGQEDAWRKEFDELDNKKLGELTGREATRKEELRMKLKGVEKTRQQTKSMKAELDKIVGDQLLGSRLRESYNERAREKEDFQVNYSSYATLKHHDAARKTIDSAIKAGANNTNRVHDIVDMAAKLSGDTGVVFNFKSYDDIKAEFIERQTKEIAKLEALEDPTFGQQEKLKILKDHLAKVQSGAIKVNGVNTGKEIDISLDSVKALDRLVGHEITHSLEKAKHYDALKNSLFAYAKSKGMDIQSEIANRNMIYEGVSRSDPEGELVADLVGDFLFNDTEYIRDLATNDRNLFQRMYDEVKHLLKMATAGSKEARQLEKVKHAFEKAYRETSSAGVDSDVEVKHSLVEDQETIDFLENQEHITVYKAMVLIDGKLYPPMASQEYVNEEVTLKNGQTKTKRVRKLKNPSILGRWQKSDERPDLVTKMVPPSKRYPDGYGSFDLLKSNGKSVKDVAYNPYEHTSNIVLNDQFSEAYQRPELVTVEYQIPASELTSGYKAQYAKDSVGLTDWKAGGVAQKLKNSHRDVYLTRWSKPVRVVPDAEVAQKYKEILDKEEGISVPWNVVTPSLRTELEKIGVPIDYSDIKAGSTIRTFDAFMRGEYDKPTKKANKVAETMNVEEDEDVKVLSGGSVAKYSLSTWTPEMQEKVSKNLTEAGFKKEDVDKWIKDTNSIASVIASDKARLDFEAADNQVMLKDNQEYIKTLDASTLCAKRLAYQGTFNAIQHRMPNTVLTSDMLIDLLNIMKSHKVQTPCGVCYVESRRRHLGKFAQQWLDSYEGEYKPRLDEITTSDGLEELRKTHPQAHDDFVAAMSKKGSSNPKVVQLRTEYRNEIMSLTPAQIRKIEAIGGLRVQSFSDFETPHLLDMMQAVMDMSAKGLHSQAYTKVPNFAWVFGDTGIKINLSLIAEGNGFDSNGNLAFSSTEGMDINEAMRLRDAYSKNVGTIIVGANDKHILACMADDRIDFIIPFHRSGWGMRELEMMGMDSYTDYTYGQKEHDLNKPTKVINGVQQYAGLENLYPPDYWNYELSGKENAERYLNLCAKLGREPKFAQFLVNNGDGSYSLQPDGSTDGYWKTLIDFKMYDNEGNGAAQQKVVPNFNMTEAHRVLNEYEGGANKLPVSNKVVEEFVAKYNSEVAPVQYSLSDTNGRQLSEEQQNFFKKSAIRDKNGSLMTLYHGTQNDFTVFDISRSGENYDGWSELGEGIYLTPSKSSAEYYGDNAGWGREVNLMEVYADIKNPFNTQDPVDFDISDLIEKYELTEFDERFMKKAGYRLVDFLKHHKESVRDYLTSKGFDGVWEKDSKGYVDQVVAYAENQVKNVDNTNPTEDPDIRYSLSDNEGNQLSKNQAEFFKNSKIRDKDGNLRVVYHTTKNDFTVFDKSRKGEATEGDNTFLGFFFAESPDHMEQFPEFQGGKTDAYYLDMKNPMDLTNLSRESFMDIVELTGGDRMEAAEVFDEELEAEKGRARLRGDNNTSLSISQLLHNMVGNYYHADFFDALKPNYDKLIEKGYDGVIDYLDEMMGEREFVVFESNQAKLTSNQNPTQDQDIRHSVSVGNTSRALTNEDIAPIRRSEAFGSDFFKKTPPVEDIAPVTTVSETENVAPATEESSAAQEEVAPVYETEGGQQSMFPEEPATSESTKTTRKALHAGIIERVKASFAEKGFDFDSVLRKAKNLSTFATVDNTPQRVMEKALGYKEGGVLADFTVNKVAQNETEGIKWLNSFTDRKNGLLAQISKQYQIKPGSKESAAAQMYAEGFYVDGNNNIVQYGDRELAIDFPDMAKQAQIKGLARDSRIRQIYDDTLNAINESRTRNAYPEIPRLDNYFLHFRAMNDTFSQLGLPFNPNDIRAKDLPTDLNGVTADLKPGQPFFASAMHREGKRTSFDLLGGLEQYLSSAKNQIYHIDDIQNLRALRNYIADTYGQANGLEGLDALSEEEAQQRIEQVYNSHLSTFAKFLNEEANMLAGKTALIDRGLEGIIGRRGMTFLDTLNRQVGANMVGYNVSSSLTNFLAPVQAFAKTNKFDFVKGFAQTVANRMDSLIGAGDNFAENSPVMIRRKGADRFHRTLWQKMSDPGYLLMSAVDSISTEIIARAKYNEFTRKGMDSQKAHFETDKWVSRLMGDRSLGQQPQLYNSKMLGIITKFQLEVRNQLDSQFYDTIQEAKVSTEEIQNQQARNAKTAAKVTSTFVQLAVAQHLFGKAFEAVAGYNPAFDIISAIVKAFGWDDDEESEDTALDNIEQGFFELMEDMPYYSTFTGGRIPIESALPIEELVKGKDQYGNDKSRWDTLGEAAPYYFMPGGYGQIKKSVAGLKMFSDDHPIAGSYTDSGKLRFPVEDTLGNRAQAAIFGQWASDNARDYFDNDLAPLPEKQTQEFVDVGMSIQDYRKYRADIGKLGKLEEKIDYINGLNLTTAQKNILVNNLTDRKDPIDMSDYDEYSGLEEFDYANENPEKYAFFDEIGITYETYKSADKDTKKAYDWAFENPDKLPMSKAVARDVVKYRQFTSALNDIKADKDSSGKSISGSRKEKVLAYINGLNIDYGAKLILFKSEYTSDDDSNYEIVEYLNSRDDISYEEMVEILKELGITVRNGTAYWD